jgi:two-component sensor histidine kinase
MQTKTKVLANVKVEGRAGAVPVAVSAGKPEIPLKIIGKWQNIVDLLARGMGVPSGQITRFTDTHIEILIACREPNNPFRVGEKAPLGTGMLCETVAGKRGPLTVYDCRSSSCWEGNPSSTRGLLSYIGVPVSWEDGELFGTVCFLDAKPKSFSPLFTDVILQLREIIEADLQSLLLEHELRGRLTAQQMLNREAHHRINNHFSMLISYIQLRASEREADRDIHDELLNIQHRIRSIALIHEKLCASARERMPSLDSYLAQLTDEIVGDVSTVAIDLCRDIEPLELSTELTVAIGLIVAELITNSVKYAFSGIPSPRIEITVGRIGENRVQLHFRDNGVGLPQGFDVTNTKGLGMTIIRMQVEQLNGVLEVGTAGGAEFRMAFDGS